MIVSEKSYQNLSECIQFFLIELNKKKELLLVKRLTIAGAAIFARQIRITYTVTSAFMYLFTLNIVCIDQ